MDNVASIDKVMVSAGSFIPCVRILRGLDVASRDKGANYALHLSFSYPVARVAVTTPTTTVLVSATTVVAMTGGVAPDPVWQDVQTPAIPVAHAPDAGTNITCNVKMTIT